MQKFATARWLVNGCQSTPTVHIRKGNPSAAMPKVRDNRMNPAEYLVEEPEKTPRTRLKRGWAKAFRFGAHGDLHSWRAPCNTICKSN